MVDPDIVVSIKMLYALKYMMHKACLYTIW